MCEYQGMQDIHAIGGGGGGGGGRLFGGGGGGGGGGGADRRLRPNQANNIHGTGHHHHHHHQALKCPRCDSLNTKFCYYNNYNLSQPRHFCKSCRRYWTKGGVLRNVPIGGGCRKSKRSSKPSNKHTTSSSSPTATSTAATATATKTTATSATNTTPPETTPPQQNQEPISSNSHSSSESSSLTATTNTATTAGAGNTGLEAISGHSSANSILNGIGESKLFVHMNNGMQPGFEASFLDQGSDCGGIFSEIGSFTSLITSTNEQMAQFGFSNLLNQHGLEQQVQQGQDQHWQQQQEISMKMQNMAAGGGGLIDQTVEAELSAFQNRNGCGFTSLDWQGNGDQGFFDLSSTVDPAYWSSSQSQWTNTTTTTTTTATTTDQDHHHQHQHQHQHHPSLYLP